MALRGAQGQLHADADAACDAVFWVGVGDGVLLLPSPVYLVVRVCVCVCVHERERDGVCKRESTGEMVRGTMDEEESRIGKRALHPDDTINICM